MKSQSIAYLLRESECSYCIFCLQGEVHSTWDLCKGDLFFIVRQGVQTIVDWDKKKKQIKMERLPKDVGLRAQALTPPSPMMDHGSTG